MLGLVPRKSQPCSSDARWIAQPRFSCDRNRQPSLCVFVRTTAPDVYALGDVCSHHMLKHVANAEARVVQHNLVNPDDLTTIDNRFIPHAVFSDPQVASVGLTSEQAEAQGRAVESVVVGSGLRSVQHGLDVQKKGVSAAKVVVDGVEHDASRE